MRSIEAVLGRPKVGGFPRFLFSGLRFFLSGLRFQADPEAEAEDAADLDPAPRPEETC
jgi:hypothetical protein